MKIYEIYDEENEMSVGVLLYYEKSKDFIIELRRDLDEWNAPLLFTRFVKEGVFTIPRDISLLWVKERVIPSGRQNIGSILSTHGLKEYNEMKFLELSEGRCSQDALFVREINAVPEYVLTRNRHNLVDCVVTGDNNILCFFLDETIKKIALSSVQKYPGVAKIIGNQSLYESCELGCGGYYATFNNDIDIPSWLLYEKAETIELKYEDFITFAKRNIIDTAKACEILDCSRQNISYMTNKGLLNTVMTGVKGNLYLKKDVLSQT